MLDDSMVTEEFREYVCKTMNTSLAQLRTDVKSLQEWVETQPHIRPCPSENVLTSYLLATKNRMERAKQKISNSFTVRSQIPEFFSSRDPTDQKFKEVNREVPIYFLPKMTPEGCRVLMVSFTTGNSEKYDFTTFFNRVLAQEEVKMNSDPFNKGRYVVFDASNFSMSHVFKNSPLVLKNAFYFAQEVLPIHIKRIILFNASTAIKIIVRLIKPLIRNKMFEKIQIHTEGVEILDQYFPPEMLPKDYGGEENSIRNLNEGWLTLLEEQSKITTNSEVIKTPEVVKTTQT